MNHDDERRISISISNNDLYAKLKPYFINKDQLKHIIQVIGNINVNNDDSVGDDDDIDDNNVIDDKTQSSSPLYGIIFEAKPGCGKSSILTTIRSVLGSYIDCAGPISTIRYSIPTFLPIHLPTYVPTLYLRTYLPTYVPTYVPTYLPTYVPTYLPTSFYYAVLTHLYHT